MTGGRRALFPRGVLGSSGMAYCLRGAVWLPFAGPFFYCPRKQNEVWGPPSDRGFPCPRAATFPYTEPTTGVVPSLFHWGIPGEMTFSPINSQRVYSVALLGSRRWPGRGAKRIGWAGSERPGLRSGLCLTLPQPIRGR